MQEAKLIMVTEENNNKQYFMKENTDGTFTAEWGRVGLGFKQTIYPMSKWVSQYKSKLRKGYVDKTDLFIKNTTKSSLKDISNTNIKAIFDNLQQYSNTSLAKNYEVSADSVTQKQIDEAQDLVNSLTKFVSKRSIKNDEVNPILLELFKVIPRKMGKVKENLFDGKIKVVDFKAKITEEQDTLDVMANQVSINTTQNDNDSTDQNILDILGVEVTEIDDKEIQYIKKLMGPNASQFKKAFKIKHKISSTKLDKCLTKKGILTTECRDLWHGSKNENWLNILNTSLVLRPTSAVITGKMFGFGIYFADKAQKSIGYSSLRGSYFAQGNDSKAYLALFNVALGKMMERKHHEGWMYQLDEKKLQAKGEYHSLFAVGGADLRNNEYIIYDDNQCSVNYLIEIG